MVNLKNYVSEINDFPKHGIVFKDINPIYRDPLIWKQAMRAIEDLVIKTSPDLIAGIESRGFIIASALAYKNEIGFIPIRKSGKLPGKVIGINYHLEYGSDRLEVEPESIKKNSRVIIIDDLLATGGTASTAGKLITEAEGQLIGYGFLIELSNLNGRKKLNPEVLIKSSIIY